VVFLSFFLLINSSFDYQSICSTKINSCLKLKRECYLGHCFMGMQFFFIKFLNLNLDKKLSNKAI
jgi:hypothetical protein